MAGLGFSVLSLAASILLGTYTTFLCGQPPNPTPYNSKSPDSMKFAVAPSSLFICSSVNVTLSVLHVVFCLTHASPPSFLCPNLSNIDHSLFFWASRSTMSIAAILLGSAVRLSSFYTLGQNFTFRLAKPKTLITSGLYEYAQHPSYTGKASIKLGNLALL